MSNDLGNCVALGVADMDVAASYYEAVLGYSRRQESEDYIEMDTGALRVFLCRHETTAPIFEMLVDDVQATSKYLSENGFQHQAEFTSGTYMSDPFGHVYCVINR